MNFCPNCIQDNAVVNGVCRFCGKRADVDLPLGVLPPRTALNGGRYLTGLPLGTGGFGVVYRARDIVSGRMVAIKEYAPLRYYCRRQLGGPALQVNVDAQEDYEYGMKHFLAEVTILKKLQGIPEVVRIYDTFRANQTAYYVMELLEGQTLGKLVKSQGDRLGFSQTVNLLMPAMLALSQVHEHGVLHRDISPDNIYFCADGSIRLIDFGAAALPDSRDVNSFTPVEKEGYSPPEQHTISHARGNQGTWSDVYAFAGTVYYCVMGKRPPPASYRQAGDELEFDRQLSDRQIRVLQKGLALDTKQRYQSMLEFAAALAMSLPSEESGKLLARCPVLRDAGRRSDEHSRVWSFSLRPSGPSKLSSPVRPETPGSPELGRQLAAFCLDMLLFQLVPFAVSVLAESAFLPWLAGGALVGFLVSWLLTMSGSSGGPGEILCGLRVRDEQGNKPSESKAALYCLLRIVWPLKLADGICCLATGKSLVRTVSGCHSVHGDGSGARPRQQVRIVCTAGFFAGSAKELEPGREYMVGRDPDACSLENGHFQYPQRTQGVSRRQLSLRVNADGSLTVTNLSRFGTYVDGRLLGPQESAAATNGSEITFGAERMQVSIQ